MTNGEKFKTAVYKPRKKSPYKQMRLFDMPTDKQKR